MEKEQQLIMHSKGKMASFGFGSFSREFLAMAFGTFVFYFYEGEIGLNSFLVFSCWHRICYICVVQYV
jgi:hypothetical protein